MGVIGIVVGKMNSRVVLIFVLCSLVSVSLSLPRHETNRERRQHRAHKSSEEFHPATESPAATENGNDVVDDDTADVTTDMTDYDTSEAPDYDAAADRTSGY